MSLRYEIHSVRVCNCRFPSFPFAKGLQGGRPKRSVEEPLLARHTGKGLTVFIAVNGTSRIGLVLGKGNPTSILPKEIRIPGCLTRL